MNAKDTINEAINYMLDELDADPRALIITKLKALAAAEDLKLDPTIRLQASIAPGGKHLVTDQHGRQVEGVNSVAFFVENGQPVFQLNL